MPTWTGWEAQLLKAASVPNVAANRTFLDDWAKNASTNCHGNPIDLSHAETHSLDCASLPGTGLVAKTYDTHAHAAAAFNTELHNGKYGPILAALRSQDPYGVSNFHAVATNLDDWGSPSFAVYYADIAKGGSNAGGPPSVNLPHGRKAIGQLQHTLAHDVPTSLRRSKLIREHALRRLGAPRKLR